MNQRIFVAKKPGFQVEARSLSRQLKTDLQLPESFSADMYCIYDVFDADEEDLRLLKTKVLGELFTDEVMEELPQRGRQLLAYEYLPGQYDQRADSARQCLMLLKPDTQARIHSGTLLAFDPLDEKQTSELENYLVNPVEARIKDLDILDDSSSIDIAPVAVMEGFVDADGDTLEAIRKDMGLAMSDKDLAFVQTYFRDTEKRNPTQTEIRVLDTYWSDHCRHTTFETVLDSVAFEDSRFGEQMEQAWQMYLNLRHELGRDEKPVTLMDLATIAGRTMRSRGQLDDEEISDEINACSIEVEVDVDGVKEPWLLMFKNETHNHPTEIEPFGGASTCIGGAIRDPLSGRSYVYQAMRITGAGDIMAPLHETLEHKLPQSKISKTAARGYSSYGNQIGLATTYVEELFDPGYTAKRMEVGAVAGAAPKSHVRREKPAPGDVIVLIGGATGRDGIGGATGSSKEHTDASLTACGSEVQKGNAIMERRLQRLFRNPAATRMIKKANDFGAGGVSVAVGELADGLDINLDAVPVKYEGLDGTELAISESQERMAACIAAEDLEAFLKECEKENLDGVVVATVSDTNRLVMHWQGNTIVDMDRAFLDTNGVRGHAKATAIAPENEPNPFEKEPESLLEGLQAPNTACQQGLAEMFDASIGKSTVLMPFGGRLQRTPEMGSVQKFPVDGFTSTCSIMTYGFDPALSRFSPWLGAQYSVVEALARMCALGGKPGKARLSNQEYFERLGSDEKKWGMPFQALLGLVKAQMEFETPSIGGKDSMSGTFNDLHVPPTLITFAAGVQDTDSIVSSAFKKPGSFLYLLKHSPKEDMSPDYEGLKENFAQFEKQNEAGNILSARIVKDGGLQAAAAIAGFGNNLGADIQTDNPSGFELGSILVETDKPVDLPSWIFLGHVTENPQLTINGETTTLDQAWKAWTKRYDSLYPRHLAGSDETVDTPLYEGSVRKSKVRVEKPVVLIPVFPGQNCEIDTKQKFERAGGQVKTLVFNNLDEEHILSSIDTLAKEIEKAQILMLAGGFSLADEPDGSGKFIVSVLKNEKIKQAVETMRANDGLILGICNGFQALVKSGLLPQGEIADQSEATLFRNDINRHISRMARMRLTSNASPWLQNFQPGQQFVIPISHGEGKFMASPACLEALEKNGQIAFQYCDEQGNVSMDGSVNPNGSMLAIEGLISADGSVLGKMGHSERYEPGLFQNIEGNLDQNIFESGIRFFTHEGLE